MVNDARSCRHLPRLDLTYEGRPDLDVSVCCWALLVGAMRWNSEGGRKKHPNEKSNLPYPLVQVMGGFMLVMPLSTTRLVLRVSLLAST